MFKLALRLRIGRLLVILIALLAVGSGHYAHASHQGMGDHLLLTASIGGGEQQDGSDDGGPATDTHCGLCHVYSAMPRAPDGVRSPVASGLRVPVPVKSSLIEGLAPDLPARPPRRMPFA